MENIVRSLDTVLLFALAASCGAGVRYGLNLAITRFAIARLPTIRLGKASIHASTFPWGIFFCNVFGSFLFGLVWNAGGVYFAPEYRTIVLSGFLGSFTTFSTFIFDTHILLKEKTFWSFAFHTLGQLSLGMLAFTYGVFLSGR